MLKLLAKRFREYLVALIADYIKEKHGVKSNVCSAWAENGKIYFKFMHSFGALNKSEKVDIVLRKLVGQTILMTYGIMPNEPPPLAILLPFPSLLRVLGVRKFISLIKNWPGSSEVGCLEVVKYKLFF